MLEEEMSNSLLWRLTVVNSLLVSSSDCHLDLFLILLSGICQTLWSGGRQL